jgi:lysophospholipase L1-like esterase
MPDQQPNRYIPAHVEAFPYRLPNFANRLNGSGSIKIVAIGSSSTIGEGDIVPFTYRLETALKDKYPNRMIDVLNRGIKGQEAPDELARMHDHVIAEAPALAIWQVGTNAVWQPGHNLDDVAAAIEKGLKLLGGEPMDVVMMDLQYAPAVLTDDKIDATRRMLADQPARDCRECERVSPVRPDAEISRCRKTFVRHHHRPHRRHPAPSKRL